MLNVNQLGRSQSGLLNYPKNDLIMSFVDLKQAETSLAIF